MSEPQTQITRRTGVGMIGFRGDPGISEISEALTGATGCTLPGTRRITSNGDRSLAWMSPDEFLVFCPKGAAAECLEALTERLAHVHHLAVDMSDARTVFRITGAAAREVLAKGTPADLAPGRFGPGDFRRTRLDQVAVAFWMPDGNSFDLVCFRSVADHVELWLKTAAEPDAAVRYF